MLASDNSGAYTYWMSDVERSISRISFLDSFGTHEKVGEAIVKDLIEKGTLPRDYYFRILGLPDEKRSDVSSQDVLAAIGIGIESPQAATYLRGPLPDCVFVPVVETSYLEKVLIQLDEDYHRYSDIRLVAKENSKSSGYADLIWQQLIQHFDPDLGDTIDSIRNSYSYSTPRRSKVVRLRHALGRTVIKDSAIYDVFIGKTPVNGIGPVSLDLIYHLIATNHPKLVWEGVSEIAK